MKITNLINDVKALSHLPKVEISLMGSSTEANNIFYSEIVKKYYASTRRRYKRFPLLRENTYGVALCKLPADYNTYFMMIEAAARRNQKKAVRLGYTFQRINYNDYLHDVSDVIKSTDHRQGKMPDSILNAEIKPCTDPASNTNVHDYPYFGVLREGKLFAYASCMVSGEICMLATIYGHADCVSDGIVPMLIIGIAEYIYGHYPYVKYYSYGNYFGATESMRRFKRKFAYLPHQVHWYIDKQPTNARLDNKTDGSE